MEPLKFRSWSGRIQSLIPPAGALVAFDLCSLRVKELSWAAGTVTSCTEANLRATTDRRGVPRPQGAGVDIGAFEYLSKPIFMGAPVLNPTNHQLQLSGLTPNHTLSLQASTNLLNWWDVTNFTTGPNDAFQCVDPTAGNTPSRFYRLKSGTP